MHAQVDGLTSLPPPLSIDSLAAWQDYMMTEEKRFFGTLKRAQLHAIMQRGIHADVQHFHRRLFAILEQGGLQVTARDTAPMTIIHRMHRCLICQKEWDNYRSWAVHCFKRHQRLSAFRQLQTGNRCEACGRLFSNHTRLTRHFRSVPACARTLAAQQRWSAPQPAMGSKLVSEAMPYDSMIPYIDTYEPVLPERAGWAMTDATMQALRQTSAIDWRLAEEPILKNLEAGLRELPLHYTEFDQVIQAQLHYYEGNELACQKLHAFATSFRSLFGEVQTCTAEPAKPSPDHLKDLDQLEFRNYVPPLRGHPRFHYILHLFAGAKRDGDLHSCLDQVPCEDGAMFFPISLDVILDPDKGDLLNSGVQAFWLDKTLRGLVYATVAGPPCETWSVSEVEAIRRRPRAEASTFCCRSLLSDMVVESSQDPRAQADICGKPTLTVQLVDDGCALRDQHAWYLGASFGAATQAHWYSSINLEASCGTIDAATPKYLSDPYQAGIFWGKGPKAYDVDDCRTTFCEGIYDSGDTTRKDNKPTSTTAADGPHRERFCYLAFEKVPSGIVQSYSKCTTSWTCRSTISLQ